MADPYWRYGVDNRAAPAGGSSIPSFPGYLPSEASSLPSHSLWGSSDPRGASDFLHKDIITSRPGAYGIDDTTSVGFRPEPVIGGYSVGLRPEPVIGGYSAGVRPGPVIGGYSASVHPEPVIGGFSADATTKGYSSPLDDPYLLGIGVGPGTSDIMSERPDSLRKVDGLPTAGRESNVLFVDGLPNDCSRREVSHLFRPFIGFREIRVVHKEPRRTGDKAMVLCFVEFSDSKCAHTALEALQEKREVKQECYRALLRAHEPTIPIADLRFDNKKPESAALRIHFAHFPFRLPSDREEPLLVAPR